MRLLVSLLIGLFFGPMPVLSQNDTDSLALFHQSSLESITVLKNENNLLPFGDLSSVDIAHLSIGTASKSAVFKEILNRYTIVKSLNLPLTTDGQQAGDVFKYLINYSDVVLISVNESADIVFTSVITDFLQELHKRLNVMYIFTGNEEVVRNFPLFKKASTVLFSPNEDDYTQSLIAQIVFGARGSVGRLATATDDNNFRAGTGISTKPNGRLGYGPAELVGMDGVYLKNQLDSIITEGLDSMAFPGAQVLIAKDGQVVFQKNYGFHTYDKKQLVRSEDVYDLASVTKVTTAVPALMKMQDEGLFDVDSKMGDVFPFLKGSDKENLHFRQVLAHHARLQPYIVYWQKAQRKNGKYRWWTFKTKPHKKYSIKITDDLYLHRRYKDKMMAFIRNSPLNETPRYVYSGLSFLMYPDLIKARTGRRMDRYLRTEFYDKLGANRLTFNPLEKIDSTDIIPTERDDFFRFKLVHGTVHDEAAAMLAGISANAGLFGNATDLAKLLQMYLNEGQYGGEQFIQPATIREFTQCQFCEEGNRRGLGFDKPLIDYDSSKSYIAKSASKYSYGHSGFTGTFFWADPAENLLVILLTNRVYPTRNNRKLYTLNLRPRLHQAAYDAIYRFEATQKEAVNEEAGKDLSKEGN